MNSESLIDSIYSDATENISRNVLDTLYAYSISEITDEIADIVESEVGERVRAQLVEQVLRERKQ